MTLSTYPQSDRSGQTHPELSSGSCKGGRSSSPSAQVLPSRLLILLVALASVFLLFSTRVQAEQPLIVTEYVVSTGDTLWSIASSLAAPDEDVRRVVAGLRDLNELEGGMLRSGQVLLVPGG